MKNACAWFLLLTATPAPAMEPGPDLKLLDKFAGKATKTVDVTMDGSLLQLAAGFLSSSDPEEAKIKKIAAGLKGIYVKEFEFAKEGEYSESDLAGLRAQLKSPAWSRIFGLNNKKERKSLEVFLQASGENAGGLTIITAAPKALSVVQILGTVSLADLNELSGNLGVPQLNLDGNGKPPKKESK